MTDRPEDIAALKTTLAAAERLADGVERERCDAFANQDEARADAAHAKATASGAEALIAHLSLQIEKLRRGVYAPRSERTGRLLDQLEMQFEDAEAALSEDERAAEQAAGKTTVASFERWRRGSRRPFPEHLPRERVVMPGPCACCGSDRLCKMSEDIATDGRICLTNNAAKRALRGIALGRKSQLFAGSDRGADRCAVMLTLIMTAKLNDVDPQAWLADVLARIAGASRSRLSDLLPWKWRQPSARLAA